MKICIFVKGASNRGKSTAILELARLLKVPKSSKCWIDKGNEIRGIHHWKGVKVGLCSNGDPGCGSLDWLRETAIEKDECDIIVAACRRGGSTQDPILPYLEAEGYTVVETYPSMIKIPGNGNANYQILAKALAYQIFVVMNQCENLLI